MSSQSKAEGVLDLSAAELGEGVMHWLLANQSPEWKQADQ